MRKLVLLSVLLMAGIWASCHNKQNSDSHPLAVKAAESWLALIDAEQYEASWEGTASLFRKAVPQEKWVESMRSHREPLGSVVSRQVESTRHMTSLPGAPDGDYVVIQFKTAFANKKSAVETVTPRREADGTWKVSGYYIK